MPVFPAWSLHRYRARESGVTVATFVFLYFAAIILVTASLVVVLRNPIYSALSLLVMFFHVAGLYVTLHAEFLAAIQIIVYAGAILVLYLFVVMLLNVKRDERYSQQGPVALFLGAVLLTEAILLAVSHGLTVAAPSPVAAGERMAGNTESIGEVLYSALLFPCELAALIVLVALIVAVILSKKGMKEANRRSREGTTHQSPGGVI